MATAAELAIILTAVDRTSPAFRSAESGMAQAGRAAGALAATAGVAFGALTVSAIGAASDVAESQSKVAAVFKSSAGIVDAASRTSAASVGLSRGAYLDLAGTLGNLLTAQGLSTEEAAKQSVAMVKLAADHASFNNLNPAEAFDKLRAGIIGEAEPLRSLGISINAAMVEQKAMSMGMVDAAGKATELGKVQARMALITAQSGNAMGDFARTSSGLANSQRIVAAEMANLRVEIGQALLPLAEKLIPVVRGIIGAFVALPAPVKEGIAVAGAIAAALTAIGFVVGPLITVLGPLVGAIGGIGAVAATVGPALTALGGAVLLLATPVGLVVGAIAALGLAFAIFPSLRQSVADAITGIRETIASVASAIPGLGTSVYRLGADIVGGIVAGILSGPRAVVDALVGTVQGAIGAAKAILGIRSPSAVAAAEIGTPIAQGIAQGLLGGSGTVSSALASVTDLAAVRPGGGVAGGGFGGGALTAARVGSGAGQVVLGPGAIRVSIGEREIRDMVVLAQREAGFTR